MWLSSQRLLLIFVASVIDNDSLHVDGVLESREGVVPFDALDLLRGELLDELLDWHVATADSYEWVIAFLDLDVNSSLTKLVYALRLPQKHYFHFVFFWMLVDERGHGLVDRIGTMRNVTPHKPFNSFIQIHQLRVVKCNILLLLFQEVLNKKIAVRITDIQMNKTNKYQIIKLM